MKTMSRQHQRILGKQFERVAKAMIQLDSDIRVASRYLCLSRRERILKSGAKEAMAEAKDESGLGLIRFVPPLSVHGEPSLTVVRAERLELDGFPISNSSVGTTVSEVISRIEKKTGDRPTPAEAIEMYRDYMAGSELYLHLNQSRRFARIPELLSRIKSERAMLQSQLEDYADSLCRNRFSAVIEADSLRAMLTSIREKSVVLGCRRGRMLIGSRLLTCRTSRGEGLASVSVEDLLEAADTKHSMLSMVFSLSEWTVSAFTDVPRKSSRSYKYHS